MGDIFMEVAMSDRWYKLFMDIVTPIMMWGGFLLVVGYISSMVAAYV